MTWLQWVWHGKWVWHGLSSCDIDSVGVYKVSTCVSKPQCVCLGVACPQVMWRVFSGCGIASVGVPMALVGIALLCWV